MQLNSFKGLMLRSGFIQRALLIVFGSFIFLYFFNFIETEDVWWHLATGRWIIEHWQLPHVDIFPFSNEIVPWSCHNEWLGSTILYLIVKLFGLLGLKFFRVVFFVLILGILYRYSYKNLSNTILFILLLLVSLGVYSRSFLKPDLFNILFIQLFLINLFNYQETLDRKNLYVLPILSCIWFNIHLGALIYGVSILGIFAFSSAVQYLFLRFRRRDLVKIENEKVKSRDLVITLLICIASFLLNPYGIEGFLYPFKVFLIPDYLGFYKFAATIHEMQPPWYIFKSFEYFYYFILFALGLLVVLINKRDNFTLILLLFFSLFSFLYVGRNSAFFTIVAAFVFVVGARRMNFKNVWGQIPFLRIFECCLLTIVSIFLMIQILSIWSKESYFERSVINNRFLEVDPYSENLIKFLIENKLTGPIFNTGSIGGQMLWMAYPELRPFRDGRNNSFERSNNALLTLAYPSIHWPTIEKGYGLNIVVLRPDISMEKNLLDYLKTQPSWQLVAIKGVYVVYVKRGAFSLSKDLDDFDALIKPQINFSVDLLKTIKTLRAKNKYKTSQGSHKSVSNNRVYSDFYTLYSLGYQGAAVKDLIEALKISDLPEILNAADFIISQFPNIN